MSFIIKLTPTTKLYLGSVSNSTSNDFFATNEITMVINCAQELPNCFQDKEVKYLNISILDSDDADILQYFSQAEKFVLDNVQGNKNLFVHCVYGVSRSPTIVIALLMKFGNISRLEAQKLVEIRRPEISPNLGFLKQLDQFEEQLKAQQPLQQEEQKNQEKDIASIIKQTISKQIETDFLCNYKCRKCKADLYKSLDIVHGFSNQCCSMYVSLPGWLKEDHYQTNEAVLQCYKCSSKIGAYKLSGLKCNCNEWITPGYQIQKFKVDRKVWNNENKKWE